MLESNVLKVERKLDQDTDSLRIQLRQTLVDAGIDPLKFWIFTWRGHEINVAGAKIYFDDLEDLVIAKLIIDDSE